MKTIIFIATLLCIASYAAATCAPRGVHLQMQVWPSLNYQYIAGIDTIGSTTYQTPDQSMSPWLVVMPINGGGIAAGDFYLQDLYSGKRVGFLYSHCDSNPMAMSTSPSAYLSTFSINSDGVLKAYVQFPIGTNYQANPSNQWYCSVADSTRIGYTVLATNMSTYSISGQNVPSTGLTYQTSSIQTRFIDGDGVTYGWSAASQPLCSGATRDDVLLGLFIVVLLVILGTLFM